MEWPSPPTVIWQWRWQASTWSAAWMRSSITVCKLQDACPIAIVKHGERRGIEAEIAEQVGVMGGSSVTARARHARRERNRIRHRCRIGHKFADGCLSEEKPARIHRRRGGVGVRIIDDPMQI